jgi:hypothetical protein
MSLSIGYTVDNRVINEYEAVCEMTTDMGNRITWRKPAPLPIFPPKIYNSVDIHRLFGGTYCFHLQGLRVRK